jgi:hypothetical protein
MDEYLRGTFFGTAVIDPVSLFLVASFRLLRSTTVTRISRLPEITVSRLVIACGGRRRVTSNPKYENKKSSFLMHLQDNVN